MPRTRTQVPTLVDVAREADVSLKTASRVLNGAKHVQQDKIDRVQAAMQGLGYRPNELARGLKAQRSAAIGMIVPNLADPFTANAVHAVQEVARKNGYVVIIATSEGEAELERSEIIGLIARQIDGLLVAPAVSRTNSFADVIPAGMPIVTFDQLLRGSGLDSVTVTNRRGARVATSHLIGHGWRNIVAIGVRPDLYTFQERIAGYRAGMKAASLQERLSLVNHESQLTAEWLERQLFGIHKADAVFSLNWVCTMLTLRGLRTLGKKPGVDMPMLAFDDFETADMLTPGMSAVYQPADELGREAATLLFRHLRQGSEDEKVAGSVVLPTKLVLRGSCGCPE